MRGQYEPCRTRIGRIRCLTSCLKTFVAGEPFPEELCYTCKDVEFKYHNSPADITTHSNPVSLIINPGGDQAPLTLKDSLKDVMPVGTISCKDDTRFYCSSEPMVTRFGMWLKVFSVKQLDGGVEAVQEFSPPVWVLMHGSTSEDPSYFEPTTSHHDISGGSQDNWKSDEDIKISNWLGCVESRYSMSISKKPELAPADVDTVAELREIPQNWSAECDEQLVHFLQNTININCVNLGTMKNFVDLIEVSSSCGSDDQERLIDGNNETFWESDGNHGQHWVRLTMKKGTIVSRLYITIDMSDENYLPKHVIVAAGSELGNLSTISDKELDLSDPVGIKDELVLSDAGVHYPFIEIRIKECKDEGIDTRIHGIKIASSREADMGLSVDLFAQKDKLCRFPALEPYNKKTLYRRAQVLQRLMTLMDTVLNFLVPSWNDDTGALNLLQDVKHILPLSTKRFTLIDTFIKESESRAHRTTSTFPRLIINRRTAAEHRADPTVDPEGTNSVFNQIYEGLKPRNPDDQTLDYRWPGHYDQWWECKFVAEGIIDQGGGFRDSLCDIAEELCPPNADDPLPLPFFIRAPNQVNADSNTSRDVYVPNPACRKYNQYTWIGKLMGACFRGKDNLVLALPGYIWKKISGEKVDWSLDYSSVDAAEVKLLDTVEAMDEETFEVHFAERMWTVSLSDGSIEPLLHEGGNKVIAYEDRMEYVKLAKEKRMSESNRQIEAIKDGFLSVVPLGVLNLLTWQEIEKRVCGDPEISIEGLRKSVHLEDIEATDARMTTFWQALTNFSNADRSKFLRFVTGRKRLPCPLYISPSQSSSTDGLPEASTCAHTLYLPRYTSVAIAEERMRYAAYNCVAIDTDLNPWE